MRASDIALDIEDVCARVRPSLAVKIRYSVGLIRKSERVALRLDPVDGFHNTFSGGKDSQCLYHLVKMAGVRHKTHMSLTSVDPPEVILFVKAKYPDVELVKPRMSIYDMAKKKRLLPTMRRRWCCAEYKETAGAGKVTLTGIRREESARRRSRGEVSGTVRGSRVNEDFDQWSEHEEATVACIRGKDKVIVAPILDWTERDVWEFLDVNGIPHCELYDQGHTRIGCILCPMSPRRQKLRDAERWPHVKRNWLKTIQWLNDNGYGGHPEEDAETLFRWWMSGKSFKQFYADEFLQQKLDFDD